VNILVLEKSIQGRGKDAWAEDIAILRRAAAELARRRTKIRMAATIHSTKLPER